MHPLFILKGFQYKGGVERFMRNLEQYLDTTGYEYLGQPDPAPMGVPTSAKAIFFPVVYDETELTTLRDRGGRTIMRLAGVSYPTQHGADYVEQNRPIQNIYAKLADFVIFQSHYAKWQNFAIMGERPQGSYTVINNGVDKSVFFPAKHKRSGKVRFISNANFRKRIMLVPIIDALDSLVGKYEFEYHVTGDVIPELEPYLQRDYIRYTPHQPAHKLAEDLRDADAYLHSQLNDQCPNAVLEAVSTGLPVVTFDSGAMAELLHFNQELLAYVSGDRLSLEEDFDFGKLAQKLELFIDHRDQFTDIALSNAHLYSFEECGAKYVDVFNQQLTLAK